MLKVVRVGRGKGVSGRERNRFISHGERRVEREGCEGGTEGEEDKVSGKGRESSMD